MARTQRLFKASRSPVNSTMDSIFETQRQTHEEIERYEAALASVLSRTPATQQNKLNNEHKASQLLDRIISRVISLNELYQDQVARKAELNSLSTSSQPDDLSEFYSRIGKIKQHYQKYPDASVTTFEDELTAFLEEDEAENEDEEGAWEDRE